MVALVVSRVISPFSPAYTWENTFFSLFAIVFMVVGCFTCWMATRFANEEEDEEHPDGFSVKKNGWIPISWVFATGISGIGFLTFLVFAVETAHTAG